MPVQYTVKEPYYLNKIITNYNKKTRNYRHKIRKKLFIMTVVKKIQHQNNY